MHQYVRANFNENAFVQASVYNLVLFNILSTVGRS